jgi:hypothetical protein
MARHVAGSKEDAMAVRRSTTRKHARKRELIDERGKSFAQAVDAGKSLAADRRQYAKTLAKAQHLAGLGQPSPAYLAFTLAPEMRPEEETVAEFGG